MYICIIYNYNYFDMEFEDSNTNSQREEYRKK